MSDILSLSPEEQQAVRAFLADRFPFLEDDEELGFASADEAEAAMRELYHELTPQYSEAEA